MKKSENGLAVRMPFKNHEFASTTDLLREWENSISNILLTGDVTTGFEVPVSLTKFLDNKENECENIQRLILDEMMGLTGARDKEQFIRLVQLMITKLLDNISIIVETGTINQQNEKLLTLAQILLKVLRFIRDYFGNYFDKTEKIPVALINVYKKEIAKLGDKLSDSMEQSPDLNMGLRCLLKSHFAENVWLNRRKCTYNHFYYEKELLLHLLNEELLSDLSVRNLLYYFNFNCSSFVIYEFDRLVELLSQCQGKSEKINMLRSELKSINQLPVKINYCYEEDMPSLKEQVSTWIEEEIKYCEAGHFIQTVTATNNDVENKIHTTLSVAKLSLLVRLLVVDKIIINRTIAPMLKTVAKTFSTLQREEISFGSLETKYHAPDKATIAIMKEMLQKWINILGKL